MQARGRESSPARLQISVQIAMQINVLFFGALKDLVGQASEQVEVEPGSDIGVLFEKFARRFPELEPHGPSLLFSRNREFAARDDKLADGDEVAFLPPVSGGTSDPPGRGEAAGGAKGTARSKQAVSGGTDAVPEADSVGSQEIICRLTREAIDTKALVAELQQGSDGAVVEFHGVARNNTGGRETLFLEYEGYEEMAIEKMREICLVLKSEHAIGRIGMVHRLGRLEIGEASVVIVVCSPHRKAAFEACRAAIDRLKQIVPIWKKEHFADGAVWVEGEMKKGTPAS